MSIIEFCLIDKHAPFKLLFNQIGGLIQNWHKNRNSPDIQNYAKYLEFFWTKVDSLFQGLLMNFEHNYDRNEISEFASRQIEFLGSLKCVTKSKSQLKVKFRIDDETEETHTKIKDVVEKVDDAYMSTLTLLAYSTCKYYVQFINHKQSKELIEHLTSLVQDFESRDFFEYLNKSVNCGTDSGLLDFYKNVLSKWLKSSYLSSKSVVDLIFLLFKYLPAKDKQTVLDSFLKVSKMFSL